METNQNNSGNAQDQPVVSLDNILDVNQEFTNPVPEITNPKEQTPQQNVNAPQPPQQPQQPAEQDSNNASASTPSGTDEVLTLITSNEDSLTAENVAFRNELIQLFGGSNFDANGNLLNSRNEIVLSYENLNKYIETGEMNLDENGNLLNDRGELVRTSQDLTSTHNVVESTKSKIESEFGFKFTDETGKLLTFDNSEEGNLEFIKNVIAQTNYNSVSAFLDSVPILKDMFYHLQSGKDLSSFTQEKIDYSSIDLNNLSKEEKLNYIRKSFERQNVKNASSMVKLIESAGEEIITQNAADALLTLKDIEDAEKRSNEEAYNAKLQQEAKENEQYWKNINSVITKGTLKDFKIPDNEKSDFYKYIASPINVKGETQEDIDASKEDDEFRLLVSYMRYKGYDFSKLVKDRANVSRLEQLRSRIPIPNPKIENVSQRTASTNPNGTINLNLEALLGK